MSGPQSGEEAELKPSPAYVLPPTGHIITDPADGTADGMQLTEVDWRPKPEVVRGRTDPSPLARPDWGTDWPKPEVGCRLQAVGEMSGMPGGTAPPWLEEGERISPPI